MTHEQDNRRVQAGISRILRKCLEGGAVVEIDGLGRFRRNPSGEYEFTAAGRPRVFLAYAEEDLPAVRRLHADFERRGFDAWLDKDELLPGQNWPRAIDRAIDLSDFFVACFSRRAAGRRGYFHAELRYALYCAARRPVEEIFLIPARLDDCDLPASIREWIHYVDLFPDWERGVNALITAIRRAMRSGDQAASRLAS